MLETPERGRGFERAGRVLRAGADRLGGRRRQADQRALRVLRAGADEIGVVEAATDVRAPLGVAGRCLDGLVELIDAPRDHIGGGGAARLDLAGGDLDAIDQKFLEAADAAVEPGVSIRRRGPRMRGRPRRHGSRSATRTLAPLPVDRVGEAHRHALSIAPTISSPRAAKVLVMSATRVLSISSSERVRPSMRVFDARQAAVEPLDEFVGARAQRLRSTRPCAARRLLEAVEIFLRSRPRSRRRALPRAARTRQVGAEHAGDLRQALVGTARTRRDGR